jgi:hypothetical protein
MIFTTENSVYEVDHPNNRIRRLEGRNDPTPRQGTDGEWKTYVAISAIAEKAQVLVIWQILDDGAIKGTATSRVQQIIERIS